MTDYVIKTSIPWEDQDRVAVLFAPFRPKSLNPEAWDAKYAFWKNLVNKWCVETKNVVFSLKGLDGQLKANGASVHCLEDVLNNMERETLIQSVAATESTLSPCRTWSGYVQKIVFSVSGALRNKIWKSVDDGDLEYVSLRALETVTSHITSDLLKHGDGIHLFGDAAVALPMVTVESLMDEKSVQNNTLKLVLLNLRASKNGEVKTVLNKPYLFLWSSENKADSDTNAIAIHVFRHELDKSIHLKEKEMANLRAQAKERLKAGSRVSAKILLKRMKRMELQLTKKMQVVENLDEILAQLESARLHKQTLDTYKMALNSLKAANANTNASDIEELLEEVKENVEIVEDLSDTLGGLNLNEDESLEEELELLLKENDDPDLTFNSTQSSPDLAQRSKAKKKEDKSIKLKPQIV